MRRESTEVKSQGDGGRVRLGSRAAASKRSRLRRLVLDSLEPRTLMATSPLPVVSNQTGITSTQNLIDDSSPWIAVDPINPQKLVAVFTHRDANNGTVSITARGESSIDGGLTWAPLNLPANEFDPTTMNPTIRYTSGFASGVGFNRNEDFFVGVLEVDTTDGAAKSGVVSVDKYTFKGGAPVAAASSGPGNKAIVYQWNQAAMNAAQQPGISNFQLAVDSNLPTFTDPSTGAVQTDPNSGNAYIAWTVNSPPPPTPPNPFNQYTIELVASADGVNWPGPSGGPLSTPGVAIDGTSFGFYQSANFSTVHDTNPRLAIAQGTPGGTTGGNVTVIWDDFNSGNNLTPPLDFIMARTVPISGTSVVTVGTTIVQAATTTIRGNLVGTGTFASPAAPTGIGPGASLAIDNTLGSYSAHSGRLYLTYVDKYRDVNNEADNSDVFLVASDDGGNRWNAIGTVQVNSDSGAHDGHTGGVIPTDGGTAAHFAGRSQFEPSVAVDTATGTLALGWEDARDDAARSRTAFYLTTSIDGGATFSPQAFANRPQVATDGITGNKVVIGPLPDYNNAETSISMGTHQAIAIQGGVIHPAWSGTVNDGLSGNQLTIQTAQATYPAGPRVLSSTMGPAASTTVDGFTFNNTFTATDHTPQVDGFTVTFDRPVDISTFTPAQVQVRFRDTVTPLSTPGTVIPVGSVTQLDSASLGGAFSGAEATTFFVRFASPQSGVGTYSYTVGPNIRDRLRGPGVASIAPNNAPVTYNANIPVPVRVPPVGTFGTTVSTLNVSGANAADVLSHISVKLDIQHTYDSDLIITLISPSGTRVTLSNRRGFNTQDFQGTVFDDTAGQFGNGGNGPIAGGTGPFVGTFTPDQPLSAFNGGVINGNWKLQIDDVAAFDSGFLNSWSLTIDGGHTVIGPGSPGNKMDQNANGMAGQGNDFYSNPAPILATTNRFVGPYNTVTLPIIVSGPHIASTFVPFAPATADNLVLNNSVGYFDVVFDRDIDVSTFTTAQILGMNGPNGPITGPFTVQPEFSATLAPRFPQPDEDATHTRTFRIAFPFQSLSGTYTIQFGTGIRSTHGDLVDTNQNAGVDLLFDITNPGSTTANVTYTQNTSAAIAPGKSVTSTINVPDFYAIKSLVLGLDISYPNDPDLVATLTDPSGNVFRLFTGVGNVVGTHANFSNTLFDNLAATPIQNGSAPFPGRYQPQDSFSPLLSGSVQVNGTYTLTITNNGTSSGTLNRFSLSFGEQTRSDTGLGDPVADRSTASFRIFTMDPTNPLSSNTWTAVGPASNSNNGLNTNSSRIGGIAIDPSDPSGNTAFVAGASGGVWKTYNFLTNSPNGPTYTPMTDSGPTYGINIGSIAVFGRNNDPRQSIVVAATGEGDINGKGVGFLISNDGGTTWNLFDSTDNTLPLASRDHAFVGTSAFKVLVDPKFSPTGDVIIYAALGGLGSSPTGLVPRGGIWRSIDSGRHWARMRAGTSNTGDATDIVFDPNSGVVDAFTNPTGNIRTLYAGFLGDGVYITPNQGALWNQLSGGVGDPLIQDAFSANSSPIAVANPPDTPNGAKGRIVLAKPALTGDSNLDVQYQTWLYAADSTTDGQLNGLYLTKDNGQNWTKVRIPTHSTGVTDGFPAEVDPVNDISQPDYNILRGQGTYDIALNIDPNNPNVVYLGGTRDFQPSTLIRVDTARLSDPHSLYAGVGTLGNTTQENGNDPVTIKDPKNLVLTTFFPDPISNPYVNLLRDPNNPFLSNSTILVGDTQNNTKGIGFSNSGSGAWWTPFVSILGGETDIHRIVTIKDPVTGKTRLIVGLDQGIFSGIDNGDGTVLSTIGNQGSPPSVNGTPIPNNGTQVLPTGSRNGNLQINQFYNGAAQPSALAAQIAGALFYGMAQDNGFPQSDPNILNNGNLAWISEGHSPLSGGVTQGAGDATDVGVDQTGTGSSYFYKWPCCINDGSSVTDFFKVRDHGGAITETSRTFGLIQQNLVAKVPDPQWPLTGGFNFAVNPVSGDQIILGSGAGRLFGTENQGKIWNAIAEPSVLDGTVINGLAYGAPDPNGPGIPGALNNYLLVGTSGGHIYATFVGGGSSGNGNAWINISNGITGGSVQRVITNPNRGSHEAYAVTSDGVFHNVDTSALNTVWVNITGDLFTQTHNSFNNAALTDTLVAHGSLDALTADWRYVIPDNPKIVNGPTHPMLYVAGEGGVVRSTDNGKTWRVFPDMSLNTPVAQGNLPVARFTDLDMVLGNIDPTTGRPNVATGPNLLLATTYGRGSFGIRLAPIIFNDGTNNVSSSVDANGNLFFSGLSEQTAFGNNVTVTISDVTDPANPLALGTGMTDGFGQFSVQGNYPMAPSNNPYLYDGVRTVQIFATNASGTKGNVVTFQVTNNPATPAAPILTSPHLTSGPINISTLSNPTFTVTIPNNNTIPVQVTLIRTNAQGLPTNVSTATITGTGTIQDPGPVGLGTYTYSIQYSVNVGPLVVTSLPSSPTIVQIAANLTAALLPADDSGIKGDSKTNVTQPRIFGTAPVPPPSGLLLDLVEQTSASPFTTVILATIADPNDGNYIIQPLKPLLDGNYVLYVQARDSVGDTILSNPVNLTIKTSSPTLTPTIGILPADDTAPVGDSRTIVRRPHIVGVADPGAVIKITDGAGNLQATVTASGFPSNGHPAGYYSAQLPFDLGNGTILLKASETDVEGNSSQTPGLLNLTIYTVQGDYNRDGKADVAIYRPSNATWFINSSAGGASMIPYGYANHDIPISGDFFGNGMTDVAVFRPDTDEWFVNGGSLGQTRIQFGVPGRDTPVPAVYDSGGRTEVAVYRPDSAAWFILHSNGQGAEYIPFGYPNHDKPVPADYNGTGFAQIAVYRPLENTPASQGGGTWFIRNSATGATSTVLFAGALPGDIPVPGDYDGIGKAEEALYRPSTGQFIIFNPTTPSGGSYRTVNVGAANVDIPVPLDYSGDGRIDPAVFHPSNDTTTYVDSTTGLTTSIQFGISPLDIAVAGPLQYRVNAAAPLRTSAVPASAVASSGTSASGLVAPVSPVVGANTPTASVPSMAKGSSTKVVVRPIDGQQARHHVKLAKEKLHEAHNSTSKHPHDMALSHLGRALKGRFFA